ncbi:hypothetical protein E0Z10_g3170 [Xylaria hypoxylon]|uniref:Uncharacterized protein n=1 Tax=Xylaria hypoxylon TaxID=37992 RepID=A0A4Z0YP94_9PEZI|nr:hypothetical protein E0Z10_g3170 [Xylaria hypoxylon]
MNSYSNGLDLLGVGNLLFASICLSTSPGTGQASRRALSTRPVVIGNTTTATPIIINDDTLATPIVINSPAVGLVSDNSSFELLPSVSSNFTAHDLPAIFITTVLEVPSLTSSNNDITTPAPTGGAATPSPTTVMVDSSIPKITIETIRTSTIGETTAPDNEGTSKGPSQPLPFSTQASPGGEVTTSGTHTMEMSSPLPSVISSDEPEVTTDVPAPFSSQINGKNEGCHTVSSTLDGYSAARLYQSLLGLQPLWRQGGGPTKFDIITVRRSEEDLAEEDD